MRKKVVIICLGVLFLGAAWAAAWLLPGLPNLDADLTAHLAQPSLRITDRHGRLLYESLPSTGGRHSPVPLEQIPLNVQLATISTEDAAFYTHPGVNVFSIARALWGNLTGGETVSGASTITQQVARNLLLSEAERSERTLRRKLREAILAWQLTRRYSKAEILALYLNQSYYGGLAYGVEAAAQTYFGRPVETLDLAESALLAGLTQAPGLYNPFTDFEAAKARQEVVLGLMVRHGHISTEQAAQAAREPLVLASAPYPMQAPHFVMLVLARLDSLLPVDSLAAPARPLGSLTVRTTLDLDWQTHAESLISAQIKELNNPPAGELGHNVHNAALIALDPLTGEILAMVGSPDYFDSAISGAVNMALSPTQPGSALKPIIYAAALDPTSPRPWTPATMILDVQTTFQTQAGKPYAPQNYDQREHGPVLVREALASSLNIPAVAALDHVGLAAAVSLSNQLGIRTLSDPEYYDLSLALGGGAVRLLDLTAAYAALANRGLRVTPFSILEVTGSDGQPLYTAAPVEQVPVLDERVAWLITDILSDDAARRIGFGANSVLALDRPAAAKTGTTTNFHDNWTVGYTPDLVVGVWVGNADHQPMREVTGLTGAAPIWAGFMRTVLRGRPELAFTRPDGLVRLEVCALSGKLPTPACPFRRMEWFITGTQPTQPDDLYQAVILDSATGRLATEVTPPEQRLPSVALNLPPQAYPWARQAGLPLVVDLSAGPGSHAGVPLSLIAPNANAVFRLSAGLPAETQGVHIQAVGEAGLADVTIYVDGQAVAAPQAPPYEAWWPLEIGQHRAWATAQRASGETVQSEVIEFEVR